MKPKQKILLFIDWYLPGYKAGGPIRSCANMIDHLKNDFEFSVVTRNTDYMSNAAYHGITSNTWTLRDGTRVYYFSTGKLSRSAIYDILQNEVYDIVYLNGIFSRFFTLIPLQYFRNKKNTKVIVAARGMLAESALAIKKNKKRLFLFFAKKFGLFSNAVFHATNEQEAMSVKKIFGEGVKVQIAPNLSQKTDRSEWRQKFKPTGLLTLVCVARIAPEKNIKYALEVLKEIKADVQYDLYGPVYDKNYLMECKGVIKQLPPNIKVNFMDSLPSELVLETIAKYDFLFLPTKGENFGHVILQSMQVGVPVIISDQTMWRALESKKAGWDISLSDRGKFISVLEACFQMSGEDYSRFSKGAFDLAWQYINDAEAIEQNRQLFLK